MKDGLDLGRVSGIGEGSLEGGCGAQHQERVSGGKAQELGV